MDDFLESGMNDLPGSEMKDIPKCGTDNLLECGTEDFHEVGWMLCLRVEESSPLNELDFLLGVWRRMVSLRIEGINSLRLGWVIF